MFFFEYLLTHNRYMNLVGMGSILLLAYMLSSNSKKIKARIIAISFLLQIVVALFMLKTTAGFTILDKLSTGIVRLYACADVGIVFLFGQLANPSGPWQFIFAIKVLPIVIFFGAVTALLFYFGIIQKLVSLVNILIRPLLVLPVQKHCVLLQIVSLGKLRLPW